MAVKRNIYRFFFFRRFGQKMLRLRCCDQKDFLQFQMMHEQNVRIYTLVSYLLACLQILSIGESSFTWKLLNIGDSEGAQKFFHC